MEYLKIILKLKFTVAWMGLSGHPMPDRAIRLIPFAHHRSSRFETSMHANSAVVIAQDLLHGDMVETICMPFQQCLSATLTRRGIVQVRCTPTAETLGKVKRRLAIP